MNFRRATINDLPEIVRLLADDELGAQRERYEDPLPHTYTEAFEAIEAQVGNQILLAVEDECVMGCIQLTIIPSLSRQGMKRMQIEGVRVAQNYRGNKVGEAMLKEAIAIAKSEGCGPVSYTHLTLPTTILV